MTSATASVAKAMLAQYLPRPALEALTLRRLRRTLAHCARHVPFYRDAWRAAGVSPDDVRSLDDLRRFPIPDRAAIEADPERVVAEPLLPLYRAGEATIRRSGGSSGGPRLEVHADPRSWSRLDGFYFRALLAAGYRPFTPIAYFWSAPLPPSRVMPKVRVDAGLDEDAQLEVLERHPGIFWYYHPTALFALAKRHPERLRRTRPRGVVSHAELLTDSMREVIEGALGAPVFDQWGTSELNRMGWQCRERRGFHLDADSFVLEVLDDGGAPVRPGETGRAVVTGLINHMMPLVRYELGDLVVRSDRRCPCGRTLPMIERIEGRVADRVTLPDGSRLTAREQLEPFGTVPGLEQLRLRWSDAGAAIDVALVPGSEGPAVEGEIRARFARRCPGVALEVRVVDAISKAPTGKRPMIDARARAAAPFLA